MSTISLNYLGGILNVCCGSTLCAVLHNNNAVTMGINDCL